MPVRKKLYGLMTVLVQNSMCNDNYGNTLQVEQNIVEAQMEWCVACRYQSGVTYDCQQGSLSSVFLECYNLW